MRIVFRNIFISFCVFLILPICAVIENRIDNQYMDVPIYETIIYNIVMLGVYFIPFCIFYNLYDFLKRYLIKREILFIKYINQLLLGLGCLIIALIVVSIFTIIAFDQSTDSFYGILQGSIIFGILFFIVITIDFFINRYKNKGTNAPAGL